MLLKAENINFKYRGDKYILKDINLSVNSNEIVGIVAPSGFGKTTLAKILAGYIKPEKGVVSLEARKLSQGQAEAKARTCAVLRVRKHPANAEA